MVKAMLLELKWVAETRLMRLFTKNTGLCIRLIAEV